MRIVLGRGRQMRTHLSSLLVSLLALCVTACHGGGAASVTALLTPPDHTPGAFSSYPLPMKNSGPEALVTGPDGNLWFTEFNRARIGMLTPQGNLNAEYAFPDATTASFGLTVGPDKNLWFTNYSLGKVGFMTTSGAFTQFPLSSPYARPIGIVAGPDNALWFTEIAASINGQIVPAIGRITTGGQLSEFPIPNALVSVPQMITLGPDGNLWFTDAGTNTIDSITPTGIITPYTIPTSQSRPFTIIKGINNDLWFTEQNAIGHLTISTGKIREYPTPTAGTSVRGLVIGSDGTLWFSEYNANTLGRMTPGGAFTQYSLPSNGQRPDQMTVGPDGLLWFTSPGSNSIGAFALP